jgi:tetratricopeptide (TPR) repeat protein
MIPAMLMVQMRPDAYAWFDSLYGEDGEGSEYELIRTLASAATGQFDIYDDAMEALHDRHGDDPAWLTRIGQMLENDIVFKYDVVEQHYEAALRESEGYLPAFERLVSMLIEREEFEKALTAFASHPDFASHSPRLALLHAICQVRSGNVDDGMRLFTDNIAFVKGYVYLYDDFLRALDLRYEIRKLLEANGMMASLNAGNPDALVIAAQWEADFENFADAAELAQKAEEIEPDNFLGSIQKARAWYGLGRKREAMDLFRELAEKRPHNPDLNLYYSHALASEKKDMRTASNLAREATGSVRNLLRAYLNLWYVYMQQERYDGAAGTARKVTMVFKEHPRPFFCLGKALYMDGKAQAREELERAIGLGLAGEDLAEARRMLEGL